MVEMTDSKSLKALDVINSSGFWMTWGTLGCELKGLNAMNNFGLQLIRMTLGCELRASDAIDNPTLGSLACKGINKIYT